MRRFSTMLAVCCLALPWTAQAQDSGQRRAQAKPVASQGGGIRGVTATLPEGWLVDAGEALEFQGERGFNEPPALRPRNLMPLIDILKPETAPDLKLKAPFAISVQFKSQPDAPILPSTFKVLYGALKVDITQRITKFVQVTPAGFSFDEARIPPGRHRLILQVQDGKQRLAERELRIEVE